MYHELLDPSCEAVLDFYEFVAENELDVTGLVDKFYEAFADAHRVGCYQCTEYGRAFLAEREAWVERVLATPLRDDERERAYDELSYP